MKLGLIFLGKCKRHREVKITSQRTELKDLTQYVFYMPYKTGQHCNIGVKTMYRIQGPCIEPQVIEQQILDEGIEDIWWRNDSNSPGGTGQ